MTTDSPATHYLVVPSVEVLRRKNSGELKVSGCIWNVLNPWSIIYIHLISDLVWVFIWILSSTSWVGIWNWLKLGIGRDYKVCEVNGCTISCMHYLTGVILLQIKLVHSLTPSQNYLSNSSKGTTTPHGPLYMGGPILTVFHIPYPSLGVLFLTMWAEMNLWLTI